MPHEPQFAVVVFVFVSQPFATLASQLPKPGEQERVHAPAEQVGVAFVVEQAVPHAPQLLVAVFVLVSHPFAELPSQLPNPAVQVPRVQVPVVQVSLAFARSHTLPQPPQFASVRVFVSQPLFGLPSQSENPAAQVGVHAPATHEVVPFAFVHAVPQAPQLVELVERFASQPLVVRPSQFPKPVLHVPRTHEPVEHTAPAFA